MRVDVDPEIEALTERIIGAGFEVFNALGQGFLETVYKKGLLVELRQRGLDVGEEVAFAVSYKGQAIGKYVADIVVNDRVIVELKVVETIVQPHVRQVLNYLKASGMPVGLILNFGAPSLKIRRVLAERESV